MNAPSVETMRSAVEYNADEGTFVWLPRPREDFASDRLFLLYNLRCKGRPAFATLDANGYLKGRFSGTIVLAHRAAWAMSHGYWPKQIDHINGDRADNRLANLRACTPSENQWNRPRPAGAKHTYRGIHQSPGSSRFYANIRANNRVRYLGSFRTEVEAARAYDAAAIELHGDFARLNFPEAPSGPR